MGAKQNPCGLEGEGKKPLLWFIIGPHTARPPYCPGAGCHSGTSTRCCRSKSFTERFIEGFVFLLKSKLPKWWWYTKITIYRDTSVPAFTNPPSYTFTVGLIYSLKCFYVHMSKQKVWGRDPGASALLCFALDMAGGNGGQTLANWVRAYSVRAHTGYPYRALQHHGFKLQLRI